MSNEKIKNSKNKKINIIMQTILVFALVLNVSIGVYAADTLYRFMHNDHDALVIGEIKEIDDTLISINVEKCVKSVSDLNVSAKKKQLDLAGEDIEIINKFNEDEEYNVGDKIVASINRKSDKYEISNGIYKIMYNKNNEIEVLTDYEVDRLALEMFLNSNGEKVEFSFENRPYDGEGEKEYVEELEDGTILIVTEEDKEYSTEKEEVSDDDVYEIIGVPINSEKKQLMSKEELIFTLSVAGAILGLIIAYKMFVVTKDKNK